MVEPGLISHIPEVVTTISGRVVNEPDRFGYLMGIALSVRIENDHEKVPPFFTEAKNSKYAAKWHEAMEFEMAAIEKNGTWKLVQPPDDYEPIGNNWVFVKKTNAKG